MRPGRIHDAFPAPSYRPTQRQALDDIATAFEDGAEVVLVRAPTGSGKSLLARAICGCADRPAEVAPAEATGAYYTTPQVSQLDAVAEDQLLEDIAIIRGKRNYNCILRDEHDTPVDRAPCARISGYDCRVMHRCPYFADRTIASQRQIAGMTLAYFMQTAGSSVFGPRDIVVIDEAHGLSEWAEMYATIELSDRTVPFWSDVSVPAEDDLDRFVRFADNLAERCRTRRDELSTQEALSPTETAVRDRLSERVSELEWFCRDYRDPDSPTTWVLDRGEDRVTFKPLDPARFLHRTVWNRGNRFALLSATILDKAGFCRGAGLDPDRVALVDVPHRFPVDHRPLYDVTQGEMTMANREATLPDVARTIVRIMVRHPDEKGIIHCHSYSIQRELASRLEDFGVGKRVRTHDRGDRDERLATWLEDDRPLVFLSVTMEEALDLEGDLARWQVLCKAPFPNVGDPAVASRLDQDDWAWYYRTALRTVIQACGRVVRSPEDHGATYLADTSLLKLFDRTRGVMPPWFDEQVERMTSPSLPAFDPAGALADVDAGPPQPSTEDSNRGSQSRRNHPLADVWGE